jgi:hypothetical protein
VDSGRYETRIYDPKKRDTSWAAAVKFCIRGAGEFGENFMRTGRSSCSSSSTRWSPQRSFARWKDPRGRQLST